MKNNTFVECENFSFVFFFYRPVDGRGEKGET